MRHLFVHIHYWLAERGEIYGKICIYVSMGTCFSYSWTTLLLIHQATPNVTAVITIFTHVLVRTSVFSYVCPSPLFEILQNESNYHCPLTLGLTKWIIDDSCLGCLTFYIQSNFLATSFSHQVGGGAGVGAAALTTDALEYQALIGQDHSGRGIL